MGDMEFGLDSDDIRPGAQITGTVAVSYPGRYDGVVISAQISDSNEHIVYRSSNKKKMAQNVARLFIGRDDMPNNRAEFTASVEFQPKKEHEVKFRASVIEEHKEIESRVIFARYSA